LLADRAGVLSTDSTVPRAGKSPWCEVEFVRLFLEMNELGGTFKIPSSIYFWNFLFPKVISFLSPRVGGTDLNIDFPGW
jgi:hypothetical protein